MRYSFENIETSFHIGCCIKGMESMDSDCIDLIITDPPYNKGKEYLGDEFSDNKPVKEFWRFNDRWLELCYNILKPGKHLYFSCASDQIFDFRNAGMKAGFEFRHLLIWATNECRGHMNSRTWLRSYEPILWFKKPGKTHGLFNNFPFSALDVLLMTSPHKPTIGEDRKVHICQKPVKLFESIIRKSSLPNEIVFDPFLGSGTTLVASLKQSRFSVGFELSPDYEPIIEQRILETIDRLQVEKSQEKITGWL